MQREEKEHKKKTSAEKRASRTAQKEKLKQEKAQRKSARGIVQAEKSAMRFRAVSDDAAAVAALLSFI